MPDDEQDHNARVNGGAWRDRVRDGVSAPHSRNRKLTACPRLRQTRRRSRAFTRRSLQARSRACRWYEALPRPHRGVRRPGPALQRDHHRQSSGTRHGRAKWIGYDARDVPARPLHCIPVILKDNYDTADMPTTGGSRDARESRSASRCVRRGDGCGGRRDHARQGEPHGARPRRHDRQLARRPDAKPVRPDAHARRIERRHGRRDRGELRACSGPAAIPGSRSARRPRRNSLVGIRPTRGLVSRAGDHPEQHRRRTKWARSRAPSRTRRGCWTSWPATIPPIRSRRSARQDPEELHRDRSSRTALKGARIGVLTRFHRPGSRAPAGQCGGRRGRREDDRDGRHGRAREIPGSRGPHARSQLVNSSSRPRSTATSPASARGAGEDAGRVHGARRIPSVDAKRPRGRTASRRRLHDRRSTRRCSCAANDLRQAVMTLIAANRLDAILYPHQTAAGGADRRGTGRAQRRAVEQHRVPGDDIPRRILRADRVRAGRRARRPRDARTGVERADADQAGVTPSSRRRSAPAAGGTPPLVD